MSGSESFRDQLSRVVLMSHGNPTWDLSDNDTAALVAILANRAALIEALKFIISFEGERDDNGTVSLKSPYSWESVARVALDIAHGAIAKAEGRS